MFIPKSLANFIVIFLDVSVLSVLVDCCVDISDIEG